MFQEAGRFIQEHPLPIMTSAALFIGGAVVIDQLTSGGIRMSLPNQSGLHAEIYHPFPDIDTLASRLVIFAYGPSDPTKLIPIGGELPLVPSKWSRLFGLEFSRRGLNHYATAAERIPESITSYNHIPEKTISPVHLEDVEKAAKDIISRKYQSGELQGYSYQKDSGDFVGHVLFTRDQDIRNPLVVTVKNTYYNGMVVSSELIIGNGLKQPEAEAVSYETDKGDWRIPAEELQKIVQALFNIQKPQFELGERSYLWGKVDSINFWGSSIEGNTLVGYLDAKGQGIIVKYKGNICTLAPIPGKTNTFQARLAQGSAARATNVENARLAVLAQRNIR